MAVGGAAAAAAAAAVAAPSGGGGSGSGSSDDDDDGEGIEIADAADDGSDTPMLDYAEMREVIDNAMRCDVWRVAVGAVLM
jgi:hypothetical protein